MRVTLRAINADLALRGVDDRLYRGDAYFYFSGPRANRWHTSSVLTPRLSDMTVLEWAETYFSMRAEQEGDR